MIYKILLVIALAYIIFYKPPLPKEKVVVEKPIIKQEIIKQDIVHTTQSELTVKKKQKATDTDVIIDTKNDFKVSLNGKEIPIKGENGERFDFDKNYLSYKQESKYNLQIDTKPLQPSWGLGIGYSTNNKPAGLITIKHKSINYWLSSDGKTTAGGILLQGNFK